MCVMSMIADHYTKKWSEPPYRWDPVPLMPPFQPMPSKMPTAAEIKEFYELLERAREYDRRHNQPDCELEAKKEKLKALASELGVEIHF